MMAPAAGAATLSPAQEAPRAKPQPLAPEREHAAAKPAHVKTPRTESPAPAKPAAAKPASAARTAGSGEYGPVAAGETLSEIAGATRPDDKTNLDAMMLALLKANPNAFYRDNINALKRGAILRVPSADEVKAIGSATEAAAQVRSQIEDWQGGRAAPTRVATATETPVKAPTATRAPAKASTASTTKKVDERLELVPPKAGKDSVAMADQPGAGAGSTGSGNTELKRELARTKEALTARDQETGELKSRVKELEDLKGKNDRLINLKDSEIADLQQKLKELQAAAKAPSAPVPTATVTPLPAKPEAAAPSTTTPATTHATSSPATTPSSSTAPTIDKKDIWGDTGKPASATGDTKAATDTHAPTPATATPASTSTTPATTTPAGTSPATTAPATTTGPATPPASTTTPSGVTVTPLPPTPPTTTSTSSTTSPAAAPAAPETKPAAKPAAPKKTTPSAPAPVAQPWYQAPWVMPTALGGGVVLVLLGLLGMRKRKAPAAAKAGGRGSIADAFGDAPYADPQGGAGAMEAEAVALRGQIANDPGNTGLYLELLSLYYAERDVARFEETAAEMHAYVSDPHQPEWQEAVAMGQELAPHNALFSGTNEHAYHAGHDAGHHDPGFADTARRPVAGDSYAHATHDAPAHAALDEEDDYGFGIDTPAASPAVHVPPPPAEDTFSFDDLPPLEPTPTRQAPMAEPAKKEIPALDDDFFSGDDAVGTKLDLAKAYLDMGDPDGARSMLEEVVAEGNDAQKAEAHRLIAELR